MNYEEMMFTSLQQKDVGMSLSPTGPGSWGTSEEDPPPLSLDLPHGDVYDVFAVYV